MTAEELIAAARAAAAFAYAPYSRFRVGAVVVDAAGNHYAGANVENSAYGATICAEASAIAHAVSQGDLSRLTAIPGVGRKTAERLVLELKSQISQFLVPESAQVSRAQEKLDTLQEDIVSALVNLGYGRPAAEKALIATVRGNDSPRTFEDLLRNTLRRLAG